MNPTNYQQQQQQYIQAMPNDYGAVVAGPSTQYWTPMMPCLNYQSYHQSMGYLPSVGATTQQTYPTVQAAIPLQNAQAVTVGTTGSGATSSKNVSSLLEGNAIYGSCPALNVTTGNSLCQGPVFGVLAQPIPNFPVMAGGYAIPAVMPTQGIETSGWPIASDNLSGSLNCVTKIENQGQDSYSGSNQQSDLSKSFYTGYSSSIENVAFNESSYDSETNRFNRMPRVRSVSERKKPVKRGYNFNILYKTIECNEYLLSGNCPRGYRCQFAHGKEDLRSPQSHPLFKTELCREYLDTGNCSRGVHCYHAHDINELKVKRTDQLLQANQMQKSRSLYSVTEEDQFRTVSKPNKSNIPVQQGRNDVNFHPDEAIKNSSLYRCTSTPSLPQGADSRLIWSSRVALM